MSGNDVPKIVVSEDTHEKSSEDKLSEMRRSPSVDSFQDSQLGSKKSVRFSLGPLPEPERMSMDASGSTSARSLSSARKSFMRRTTSFDISRLDITNIIPENVSQKLLKNEINIMELPEQLISGMKREEESLNFGTKGKEIINTSFLLLILLLIRIAPTLVNSEEVFEVYLKTLQEILHLDAPTVKFYTSFPSMMAGWITLGACAVFGFVNVFLIMPNLQQISTDEEVRGISAFKLIARQLSHPFIPFVAIVVVLALSHLGFILGLIWQNYTLIIVSRVVFGVSDSIHYFVYIYFIVKDFKKEHFALAVGFIISMDALTSVAQTFIHEVMNLYTFLWTVFGLLIFSFGASLSLPYLDLSANSIFLRQDFESIDKQIEEKDGAEKREMSPEELKETKKKNAELVWGIVIFCFFHLSLVVSKFLGLFMFPFRFGGVMWCAKFCPYGDSSSLNLLREGIHFTRAILSPGIGALLDSEHRTNIKVDRNEGFVKGAYIVMKECKLHIICLLTGFGICAICNIFLLYGQIYPKTVYFHTLSLVYGFGSSLLYNSLFSLPWILIRNLREYYVTHTYSSYAMLITFFSQLSDVINNYIITSAAWVTPIWYIVMVYLFLFLTAAIAFLIYISSGYSRKIENLEATVIYGAKKEEKKDQEDDLKEVVELDSAGNDKPTLSHYIWLLLYIPLDFVVFLFCLALMFMMSGICGIAFYFVFGTRAHLSAVKVFFLPVVSILCIVSMRLAFPEVTDEFFGVMFFKRTRTLLGLMKHYTVGQKLENSSEFSIATANLQKKLEVWRYLNSNNVEKKPTIAVYRDEIVLRKEEERIKIIEDTSNLNIEDYDAEVCSNGTILVPKDGLSKSIYNYPEQYSKEYVIKKWKGMFDFGYFADHFYLLVYTGYCLFFAIPILYRILLRLFCVDCEEVRLFDDNIAALVIVINFVFGFFILIPFISLWQEISRILENLCEHTFIFKMYTNSVLKPPGGDFKKLTREQIHTWSLMFTHLNAYVLSKASFIKYIFIFSYGASKVISILFSLVALFVRVALSQEILQLIFIVLALEFAVLRYIITPASVSTNEMRLTMKDAHLMCSHFLDYVNTQKELTQEEEIKMRQTAQYFRDVTKAWEGQTQLGFVGFQFRLNEIGTAFPIHADFMRNAVYSTFITIIPSVLTYFVKLFA